MEPGKRARPGQPLFELITAGPHAALFDALPICLWIEDLSGAREILDHLRSRGVGELNAHFERHPDDLARCAAAVRIVDVNAKTVSTLGAADKQQLLTNLDNVFVEASLPTFREMLLGLDQGRYALNMEGVNRGLSGDLIWFDLHYFIPEPARDDWSTVIIAAVDITARRRAARDLQHSEERFRTIFMNAPVMIDQFASDGSCILWNHECEKQLGWTREEVAASDDPLALFYPSREDREEVLAATADADGQFRRYEPQAKDGSTRVQLWANFRLPNGELISMGLDITTQVQAEEEHRLLEEKMRHAQKLESLGVLAGGIAHDFNNLLVGVLGNADLALQTLPMDPALRESLEAIDEAAQRAAELANQMLAYSGRGNFSVKTVNLTELIREMRPILTAAISENAALDDQLDPNLALIMADPIQLRQLVFNLILNASESIAEAGRITIQTGLRRFDRAFLASGYIDDDLSEGEYVFLKVADTGSGMDTETVSKIFDPFFTTKFAGRGLGLAATLGIIRGHHGAIKVESAPAEGSTFWILLPPSDVAVAAETAVRATDAPWSGSGAILLVDDEPTVLKVGSRMLEMLGFAVSTAARGEDAVELFRASPDAFCAVILDLTMPGMGGARAIAALRAIRHNLPVLLSSGYTSHETAALGGSAFIQKPYTSAALSAALREMLEARDEGADR